MRQDRILVVGGGIAGLTAAAALGKRGWSVDLIERRPELSDSGSESACRALSQWRTQSELPAARQHRPGIVPAHPLQFPRVEDTAVTERVHGLSCRPIEVIRAEQDLRNRNHGLERTHSERIRALRGVVV